MAKRTERVAVFTRNHRPFLEEAVTRNATSPERFTTFRSSKRWAGAHKANAEHGTLKVFFAAVGGDNVIEYAALLHRVHLEPDPDEPATKEVLASELDSTREEGLWEQFGQQVRTLYVISHCNKLPAPVPITELVKSSDGTPISADYGYSYCLVREPLAFPKDFEIYPGEESHPGRYNEGATRTVSVNAYERSPAARAACIAHYGYACCVCGFDFAVTYGNIGKEFTHVHHLKLLSTMDADYRVDPIKDLRPVCPNCHAMIHRGESPMTIQELRKYMNGKT